MDRLTRAIQPGSRVGIDTVIFIYQIQGAAYRGMVQPFFSALAAGQYEASTSVVTLMEVSVQPLRLQRPEAAAEYETLLLNYPHLTVVDVDTVDDRVEVGFAEWHLARCQFLAHELAEAIYGDRTDLRSWPYTGLGSVERSLDTVAIGFQGRDPVDDGAARRSAHHDGNAASCGTFRLHATPPLAGAAHTCARVDRGEKRKRLSPPPSPLWVRSRHRRVLIRNVCFAPESKHSEAHRTMSTLCQFLP